MASDCEQGSLDLSFPATEARASQGIATLCAQLAALGLPAKKADDVKIALAEAINNVVEHAYADIAAADVQVDCRLRENQLVIRITDTGNPLPDLQPPAGIPASVETSLEDLPEGGFGWFLIHQLTSEIQYERSDSGNLLLLRFDFSDTQ